MLKIICHHFFFLSFVTFSSFPCFGSKPIEDDSSLKRPRSGSFNHGSCEPHPKRQKVASITYTFNIPKEDEAIFRLVQYARIVDGLALVSTCHAF